jgi:hypothetical protein
MRPRRICVARQALQRKFAKPFIAPPGTAGQKTGQI